MENSLLNKLLDDFYSGIENRSKFFLSYHIPEKVLSWHLETWEKDMKYLDERFNTPNGLELWSKYSQAHNTINQIFNFIHKKVLLEGNTDVYKLYSSLGKHIEEHKDKQVQLRGHPRYYLKDMMSNFLRVFFENISKSAQDNDIWEHYLPQNWHISSDISNSHPLVQRILLEEFIEWAKVRIPNNKEDFDEALDNVSRNLFPDVDPSKWAKILTFVFTPAGLDNRVSAVISKPWTFGFGGRIRSYSGTGSKEDFEEEFRKARIALDESETTNTYKITNTIFKPFFTEKNLNNFILQAKSLKYDLESNEEYKRKRLLNILEELRDFITSNERKN